MTALSFDEIRKFNHNHDALGRFSSGNGTSGRGGALTQALNDVETAIYQGKTETMKLLDGNGKEVAQTNVGNAGMTGITRQQVEELSVQGHEDLKGLTLTHNHPEASPLSHGDLKTLFSSDLDEMRCVTNEGDTYSLRKTPDFKRDTAADGEKLAEFYNGYIEAWSKGAERAKKITDEASPANHFDEIQAGTYTMNDVKMAERKAWDEIINEMDKYCTENASKYGMVYEHKIGAIKKSDIYKYNHNHGPDGRFASSNGASSGFSSRGVSKEKQLEVILSSNPMRDDYHTGIRSVDDILTAKEAFSDEDEFISTDDWSYEEGQKALKTGKVTVYSSYPIEAGTFVTPSRMEAELYAGGPGGKVHSKEVSVDDVAWIDSEEGQFAPVGKSAEKFGENITGKQTKPIDTLGNYRLTGEYELMVPSREFKDVKKSEFTIYKADEDKHLVFGWASVIITVDGQELEDRQHDVIDPEDLEEAAYEYVLNFRDTGEEHLPGYRYKGKLVESCVLTKEKQKAMGIPDGILPVGWWIGFHIDDDDTWERVKNGTYRMFSIEGKAQREEIQKSSKEQLQYAPQKTAKSFNELRGR